MSFLRTQVKIDYPGGGGPGYNSWHFRTVGGEFAGTQNALDALEDLYAALADIYPGSAVISSDGVFSGVGPDTGKMIDLPNWSVNGGGSRRMLPPFSCVNVQWGTARPGRSGRGRSFLGPCSVDVLGADTEPGNVSTTARSAVAGALDSLLSFNGSAGNGAFGVWSPSAGVFSDFTTRLVRANFASLTTRRD